MNLKIRQRKYHNQTTVLLRQRYLNTPRTATSICWLQRSQNVNPRTGIGFHLWFFDLKSFNYYLFPVHDKAFVLQITREVFVWRSRQVEKIVVSFCCAFFCSLKTLRAMEIYLAFFPAARRKEQNYFLQIHQRTLSSRKLHFLAARLQDLLWILQSLAEGEQIAPEE